MNTIKTTTSLNKISKLIVDNPDSRVYAIVGGMSSSKTFSILMLLINHCLTKPDTEVVVVSHQLSKAKLTVIKDFKFILKEFNIWDENAFRADTEYTFKNKSVFKFIGADRTDIGKGFRIRGIAYINEANRLQYETFRQIASRSPKTIIDWNADFESWIEQRVLPLPDTSFLRLTIFDNEYAPENELREVQSYKEQGFNEDGTIKDEFYANLYNVYGLGLTGRAIGAIFSNWTIGEFEDTGTTCYGLDFGFSSDPDALVKVSLDEKHKTIYLKEYLYQNGNSSDELFSILKDKCGNELIIADCAEDRLISDLKSKGLNIKPCHKNRIIDNIKVVQGYKMVVDANSFNLQNELNNYIWLDKDNKSIPIDKYNHLLDAGIRYAFNYLSSPVNPSSVVVTKTSKPNRFNKTFSKYSSKKFI